MCLCIQLIIFHFSAHLPHVELPAVGTELTVQMITACTPNDFYVLSVSGVINVLPEKQTNKQTTIYRLSVSILV